MRRRVGIAVAAIALAVGGAQTVAALPPGGVDDDPGSPPGKLINTTPNGPVNGKIGFCVENIRVDTASGPVAQQFSLKFDDYGSYGIGPFTPDANGNLCAEVSTDRRDYAGSKGGADDKIPPNLCNAADPHILRLLSGPWGADGSDPPASSRSISVDMSVAGASCGDSSGSSGSAPPPPGDQPPPPGGGAQPSKPTAPVTLRSKRLTVTKRAVGLRLKGGPQFVLGKAVLRSRGKLRVGRGSKAALRTLAARDFQIAAGDSVDLKLALSAQGRRILRSRKRLAATLTLTVSGRPVAAENVVLRRTSKWGAR